MHFRRHIGSLIQTTFCVALIGSAVDGQPLLINPALVNGPAEAPPTPSIAPPTATSPAAPAIAEKRAENAERLRIAMRRLEANGASDTATAQEVVFYQTRDAVLAQQDAVEQQIKDLESRKAELETRLMNPPPGEKQYKFADLDRMRDDLAAEQARASLTGDKLIAAQAAVQKAKAAVAECDAKRQLAQEALEAGKTAPNAVELAGATERARQAAILASETLTLRKREVEREELTKQLTDLMIRFRQMYIRRVSPQVRFAEADYKEQLDKIKKNEVSTANDLDAARTELHAVNIELRSAQQKLDAAVGDRDRDRPVLLEAVIAQRRTCERWTETIDSLTQRLQQLAQLRSAWNRRYQVATMDQKGTSREIWSELKTAQKETKEIVDELASDLRIQISKMRDVRNSLASVAKKIDASDKARPEIVVQLSVQQKQLEETLRLYEKNLVAIENSRRIHEKLLDELGPILESITPTTIALGAWYQAELLWNQELVQIGDKFLTLGKLIQGLTILIAGWLLARFVSRIFVNRFLKRFRLSKDATSAIRTLVFYSLLFLVTMSALKRINVDLTAFTILGGALAIGVGFGSQTLINNFVGGLIMLAERPVRLGEHVTFKDIDGVVEEVGFRCTKLRTPTDHLVTIPNSTLVNESIENIDRRRTIRRSFTLAVTYNISRDLLAEGLQAIRDVLEEREIRERIHPIVGFDELTPRVNFSEFAAESLNVQVTYWYAPVDSKAFAEHAERVNFRIMEEFDRLGIEFAFPSKTAFITNSKRERGRQSGSYAA